MKAKIVTEKTIKKPEVPDYKNGKVVLEQVSEIVDGSTGQITTQVKGTQRFQEREPDYVKLYLNTMMSFNGIRNIPTDVIIAMCNCVQGYNNSENQPLIFKNDKFNRVQMASTLGLKTDAIQKYITRMSEAGILVKQENMRGIYYVNPWILAKGQWCNIKRLQIHFDVIEGTWKVDSTMVPKDEEYM